MNGSWSQQQGSFHLPQLDRAGCDASDSRSATTRPRLGPRLCLLQILGTYSPLPLCDSNRFRDNASGHQFEYFLLVVPTAA